MDKERIKNAVKEFLYAIGENPDRNGLIETPDRVAKMCEEIFAGLHKDPKDEIKIFDEGDNEDIVIVKSIPLYSLCEHHLLPFIGVVSVAYIPREGKILGLSKIARVVDCISKKPQIQERLTNEIADTIQDTINPQGLAVIIEAEHLCMTMRGIRKPGSKTITFTHRGIIRENVETRIEVMNLMK